ncbi:MAG: ATP-binding protein [Microbacterium sp.]
MASPTRVSRRRQRVWVSPDGDRTRARTVVLNQLLLAAVVLVLAIVALTGFFPGEPRLFFGGVLVVFIATGAALAVPWNSIHGGWTAVVPILDIVAITLMRESQPSAGLGLLWIFPAMWLAASFGGPGLLCGIAYTCGLYWISAVLTDAPVTFATLLLPFAIIALSTSSYLMARRAAVQRRLLDNQARLLERSLARARREEETLTEVLDAVDFGVIRIAPDGRTSIANDAHGRLQRVGHEPDDDSDDEVATFARDGVTPVAPADRPFERALRGETFDENVVWFGAPEESGRALMVTARRLHHDDGSDGGAVVVTRDVTSELEAIRAREEIVASVSHELRTPLTSIVGYLELVLDEDLSQSARKGLEVAERNAERLLSIVADILATSSAGRTTTGLSIVPEPTDLAEIAEASVEMHAPQAAERGIRIETSGLEPAEAFVDPQRFRQVVDNLLSNAVKYNRDGGTIAIGTTVDGAHAWIVVRDNGIGVSESDLPRVFERFFRSDSVRSTPARGSGLGLPISRDIVRSHGGDITVQSEVDVGSTFVVRVPVRRDTDRDAPEGSS